MSTKTVAEKLLVKPGTAVWVSPADRSALRFRATKPGEAPFTGG